MEVNEKSHGIWRTEKNTNPASWFILQGMHSLLTYYIYLTLMAIFFILKVTDVEKTECTP